MIIETKKRMRNKENVREIIKITSHDGEDVTAHGYFFNDVVMKKGEIISEKEFQKRRY